MAILTILSRWIHVICACLALGGTVFIRLILPTGLKLLEEDSRQMVFLAVRRTFKIVIHAAITFFLITGVINTIFAWDKYQLDPPLLQSLWGFHILGALVVFTLSLYMLAGAKPPQSHRKLAVINVVMLLLTILAASSLKWAREQAVARQLQTPQRVSMTLNAAAAVTEKP
jgi:uncharacterized membrane protein